MGGGGVDLATHYTMSGHSTTELYLVLRRKEENILFNDALNTFYLRLYGVSRSSREEIRFHRYMSYSFRLAAKHFLYAPSHREDNTFHGLWYTSCGAMAGTRNNWMGLPLEIDPATHRTMSGRSKMEF